MSTSIGSYVSLIPAGEAGKPAAASQPFQFKATNGKTYEITYIRQRVAGEGGKWKDVDLSQLDAAQKAELIKTAALATGVFQKIQDTDDFKDAESFILTYRQHLQSGPQKFHEISYTTATAERSIKVHLDQYSPEDQKTIEEMVMPLSQMLDSVVQEKNLQRKQLKKDGAGLEELTLPDDKVRRTNKCQENTRGGSAIAKESVDELLKKIEEDPEFIQAGHPKYRALLSAIEKYNSDCEKKGIDSLESLKEIDEIDIDRAPEQIRVDYLAKIRQNQDEMLDLSFFYPAILKKDDNSRHFPQ